MKIKLNVYPIVDNLEERIIELLKLAKKKRAKLAEIAYGPISSSAKKRILNFLLKKDIRKLYHRLEKSIHGWGRIYLHFRWKKKATHYSGR